MELRATAVLLEYDDTDCGQVSVSSGTQSERLADKLIRRLAHLLDDTPGRWQMTAVKGKKTLCVMRGAVVPSSEQTTTSEASTLLEFIQQQHIANANNQRQLSELLQQQVGSIGELTSSMVAQVKAISEDRSLVYQRMDAALSTKHDRELDILEKQQEAQQTQQLMMMLAEYGGPIAKMLTAQLQNYIKENAKPGDGAAEQVYPRTTFDAEPTDGKPN